ncbi:MAG: YveK family protein [Patescibacteria group bacterium]
MNPDIFIKKLASRWQIILISALALASLTFAISAFITPKYQSDMSVLVIQKQPVDKIDAFSAAKSAEYLSDIFLKVIYTDSFIDEVFKSPMEISTKLSSDHEEKKKEWEKMVKSKKVNNTGIVKVTVYNSSRKEAERIAQAIGWNLSTNGGKYHGGGDKVVINTIDGPITSDSPTSPNIWLNALLGFIVGIIGSCGTVYFLEVSRKNQTHIGKDWHILEF